MIKRRVANIAPTPGPMPASGEKVAQFTGFPVAPKNHAHLYHAATWTLIIVLATVGASVVFFLTRTT